MDATNSLEGLKKHPDLWWEDGNVILIAEKTGFKVHRSVISRKSSVFSDMFAVSGTSTQVTFEDTPIVHLSDDPEELAYFLGAMYSGLQYPLAGHGRAPKLPWVAIKVLLVLGDKYGVDEYRQEGLRLVEAEYPKDLMNWTLRDLPLKCPKGRFGDPSGRAVIELVGVARKLRLRDVYLAALYDCCNLEAAVLVDGVAPTTGDTPAKLDPRDLVAVLNARTALGRASADMPKAILSFAESPGCDAGCASRCGKVVLRWVADGAGEAVYDPLAPGVERRFESIARDYDFCSGCLRHYSAQYWRHRIAIRKHLDDCMDVKISAEEFDT